MKGGLTTTAAPSPTGGPLVILYAHQLEAARDSVLAAGGGVCREIFSSPGGGASTSRVPTATSWRCGRTPERMGTTDTPGGRSQAATTQSPSTL